eukprot:1558594-Prymnesium_polylepis.1
MVTWRSDVPAASVVRLRERICTEHEHPAFAAFIFHVWALCTHRSEFTFEQDIVNAVRAQRSLKTDDAFRAQRSPCGECE